MRKQKPQASEIVLRRADDRGHTRIDWLDSRHTFSFGDYYDREHSEFRALRVINDDRIAPGKGFGMHPHRDMEIVTWLLAGSLEHRDNMGNGSIIRPGEVQRMTAGTGVLHSEFNPSPTEPVHLLQIWMLPERRGLPPGYEQKAFAAEELSGRLRLVASRDGASGSVTIHQDIRLFIGRLGTGDRVEQAIDSGRHLWVHVATGEIRLNGGSLKAGDGAAVFGLPSVTIEGVEPGEVLVFDLA